MVLLKSLAIVAAMWMAWVVAASQESAPADSSAINSSLRVDHRDARPDPALPSNDGWARTVIEVILLGFFLPAAIIGPWVRKRVAAEIPELHAQEEQSGLTASQHEPGHSRSPTSIAGRLD